MNLLEVKEVIENYAYGVFYSGKGWETTYHRNHTKFNSIVFEMLSVLYDYKIINLETKCKFDEMTDGNHCRVTIFNKDNLESLIIELPNLYMNNDYILAKLSFCTVKAKTFKRLAEKIKQAFIDGQTLEEK